MKPAVSVGLLLVLGFLLAGCASFARRLEAGTVAKVQPGKTTRAEVEGWLGHPKETVTGANGKTVERHFFHEFQRSTDVSWNARRFEPGQILFRTLTLSYGPSNIVERRLYDQSLTPIHRTNAWYSAGPVLTPESVALIKRDSTKEDEVVARFGRPASRTFDGEGRTVLVWFSLQTRETSWSEPDVRELKLVLDERRMVRDFVLTQQAPSDLEPMTLR